MRFISILIVAIVVAPAYGADKAIDHNPAQDVRDLMIAAIDSPSGTAHGFLKGKFAEAMTKRFHGKTPIHIDVSTEKRYAQKGCSRLKVLFWQDGVQLPEVPLPRKQTVEIGINFCRDGSPPRSLM